LLNPLHACLAPETHHPVDHLPREQPLAELFRNRYRVPSARAPWWDYGRDAAYFVTICTYDRTQFFGEVEDDGMILSELGTLAADIWQKIPVQFPFVRLQEWVVMPNHIHGIIVIDRSGSDNGGDAGGRDAIYRVSTTEGAGTGRDAVDRVSTDGDDVANEDANGRDANGRDAIYRVSTTEDAINRVSSTEGAGTGRDAVNRVSTGGVTGDRNPMLKQNLSTIVRWYKGRLSFEARKVHADFAWQARFHDHIIRDAGSHEKIRHYILNNPRLWDHDRFNPKNNR